MKPLSTDELLTIYDNLSNEDKVKITQLVIDQKELENVKKGKSGNGKNKTHCVVGKLFFEYEDLNGNPVPMHSMYLELWDRDTGNPDDFLGQGITQFDGSFEIWYDPLDAGKNDLPDLDLRVYELRHKFDKQGNVKDRRKLIYTITGDKNVTQQRYDFGVCSIPYWEYDRSTLTPRVLITEEGNAPQSYAPGRALVMVKALAGIELKKRMHQRRAHKLSIDEVQDDYPENLTRKLEEANPGITRTDEFFGDMMMNGMANNIMDRDPQNPDLFWVHYHWNSYEQDGEYAMPNIDIRLKKDGENLLPVQITIWTRQPGAKEPNSTLSKHVVEPKDGAKWAQAKRIARVSATLAAELDNHLCMTHLNVEQYAIPAYRNFRQNPIRYLLFPHVKEVSLINNSANELLLGENGYITRATGFTKHSLEEHIAQVVATLDWRGWKPRRQACENHTFARVSLLFWDVLYEYVEWFFTKYESEIKGHWYEVKKFSDEVVENSTDFFLCGYLRQNLEPDESQSYWFDWNERMKMSFKRSRSNGKEKSVSRITESETADKQGIENLKQVCRYVIHHATFMHWWSNSKQYDEGGELRFNALGLRYGKNGIFADEDDDSVLPPPEDATMQLWISYMLSNANIGFILKNEEKDIHPKLIQILKSRKEEFEKLGVDISKIPSRTNI